MRSSFNEITYDLCFESRARETNTKITPTLRVQDLSDGMISLDKAINGGFLEGDYW